MSSMKTCPLGSWQSMRSQKCGHPGFPAGFVFAGHAAGGFDFGPFARGGDAGAAGLPVAFAVFEGGKGEAEFGGGFGGFDAEFHAIGGTGLDGHIGAVEDGFGILWVLAEGAIDTQRSIGNDELHVFVGRWLKPQPLGVLPGSVLSKVSVSSGSPGLSGPTLLMPVTMGWPPFQARL
jgi:hypothetical protein